MRRWWIGSALVGGAAGLAVVGGDDAAGYAATRALRASGFPEAVVTVRRLGLDGLDATLRLDPDGLAGVDEAAITWSASGLFAGRLDSVTLRGVRVALRVADDGSPALVGRQPAAVGAGTSGDPPTRLPDLPVGALIVEDAAVALRTSAGTLSQPFRLALQRTDAGASGRLELIAATHDAAVLAPLTGGVAKGRVGVSGTLGLSADGGTLRIMPEGCVTATAEGLVLAGQALAMPGGLCLRAAEEGAPLVAWTPGAEPALALRAAAAAPTLAAPGLKAEAREVTATLTGAERAFEATLAAAVRHTARPAAIAPMSVAAKAGWSAGQPITLSVTGTGPFGLEASGRHDVEDGAGQLDIRLPRLAFAEDGAALGKAFPMLADAVSATGGGVSAKARLAWGKGGMNSSGEVLLDGVSAAVGPVAVAGVNGTVRLSSLLPPVAPAGQTLAVKLLDVGIPLTDGTLRFGYGRDGRVAVQNAEWRWAGGLLRAKPFSLAPQAPEGLVELEAEGVDFGQLLAVAAVEGLDATGRLRGRLPVRIAGATVSIENGVLEAADPGAVRYDPATPPSFLTGEPGSATDLLRGALTDFRYSELRLTVNGTAGGELTVGLSLHGANPDFYDGHPVKLNLNLSGALDRILRQSLDAYRIPDAVRERMTEFGQKSP